MSEPATRIPCGIGAVYRTGYEPISTQQSTKSIEKNVHCIPENKKEWIYNKNNNNNNIKSNDEIGLIDRIIRKIMNCIIGVEEEEDKEDKENEEEIELE